MREESDSFELLVANVSVDCIFVVQEDKFKNPPIFHENRYRDPGRTMISRRMTEGSVVHARVPRLFVAFVGNR